MGVTSETAHGAAISKILVLSYIIDWICIIVVAGIGGGFSALKNNNRRAFSLTDPAISYPIQNETVSTTTLLLVSLLAPAAIIVLLSLLIIPSPSAFRNAPARFIWRHKVWEWVAGWLGLGVALASSFMATQGLKVLMGKPRPDLLALCDPDLSKIAMYTAGGLGLQLQGAPTMVTSGICRNQDTNLTVDGFASFPSGHSSFSFAGLTYLTLWLCSKFAISFPLLASAKYHYYQCGSRNDRLLRATIFANAPSGVRNTGNADEEASNLGTNELGGHLEHPHLTKASQDDAAPPVYLLVVASLPLCVAAFISSSRYFNNRHHGFDILFGIAMGLLAAWVGFRLYNLPLQYGTGWSWAPRSRRHAFFLGIRYSEAVALDRWTSVQEPTSVDAEKSLTP